ncbi:MAG: FAD-dependent monooxygenase [Pseudomonadota bacterium]
MSRRRRALIVGGSLGGLFAAHALLRRGWDVSVFERSAAGLSSRGAGIVTHPALFSALRSAGLDASAKIGVPVTRRVCFAQSGVIVAERPHPQIVASWDQLFRLLRGALPDSAYRAGTPLSAFTSDGRVVSAQSGDTTSEVDLLVGADGLRSTVRQLLAPTTAPIYAGYVAWRGLVDEAQLSAPGRDALMESFAFALPTGEQMLGYPVPGPDGDNRPGARRFNFVWYRPAPGAALDRLLTDAEGRVHRHGIAPSAVRPEVVATMRADAERLLPPVFREVVAAAAQPFLQPIFDLAAERLVFGRAVLIGDAAFVARPHVGMGVTKAAADAISLADALDADDLATWEAVRLAAGRAAVDRARSLGEAITSLPGKDTTQDTETVLEQTAVPV